MKESMTDKFKLNLRRLVPRIEGTETEKAPEQKGSRPSLMELIGDGYTLIPAEGFVEIPNRWKSIYDHEALRLSIGANRGIRRSSETIDLDRLGFDKGIKIMDESHVLPFNRPTWDSLLESIRCSENRCMEIPFPMVASGVVPEFFKPQTSTKENEMNANQQAEELNNAAMGQAIVDLVTVRHDDELEKFLQDDSGLNSELREALEEAEAEERKAKVKHAALAIRTVVAHSTNKKTALVEHIRGLRKQIENAKNELAAIEKAENYAKVTMNYLPLGNLVAAYVFRFVKNTNVVGAVPADWTPASAHIHSEEK